MENDIGTRAEIVARLMELISFIETEQTILFFEAVEAAQTRTIGFY